jgi:hypothetical protein
LPYERKAEEEDEEVESTWNPAKLLRHCDGIDLKGRLTGNFRGARNSSSSLFVSFLGSTLASAAFFCAPLTKRCSCLRRQRASSNCCYTRGTEIELDVGRLRFVIKAAGARDDGAA